MVAFWIDEKLQRGVEVAVGFADGTDVIGRVVGGERSRRHFACTEVVIRVKVCGKGRK